MKSKLAAFLFAAALTAALPAQGEGNPAEVTDMQALRTAVRADKKAVVATTLQLTPTEAKRFWPVYDAYDRAVDGANRRRTVALEGLIALDRPISDLYARTLAADLIAADEAEIKARRTLQNRLMRGVPTRVLPPKKAARYFQLESKIRAVQAYDIASTIPLVR